jgi:hypothetical protein
MKTVTVDVPSISCAGCEHDFDDHETAYCKDCTDAYCEDEKKAAMQDVASGRPTLAKELRDWVLRRHLLGLMSGEARSELELAADDIEVGHG